MAAERDARSRRGHPGLAIGLAACAAIPSLVLRFGGIHPDPLLAAVCFGLGVVGAAFMLAWAAEVVQLDVSAGLALAMLALVAVLPEYAVDFVFTWKAGKNPAEYAPDALANMTGGNRLLIGIGWSLVVLIAAWRVPHRSRGTAATRSARRRFPTTKSCSDVRTRSRSRSWRSRRSTGSRCPCTGR